MTAIPTSSSRRSPRQARAHATVHAILQATVKVLVDQGYERASTNRIARVAGVSIGSLYQYFPSKEALVVAALDSHFDRMELAMQEALEHADPGRLSHGARLLARALLAAHRVDPRLHAALRREVPNMDRLCKHHGLEHAMGDAFRRFLQAPGTAAGSMDFDRALSILLSAVLGVIRDAIEADPGGHEDLRLEQDLTDLILRYLSYEPVANAEALGSRLGAPQLVGSRQLLQATQNK